MVAKTMVLTYGDLIQGERANAAREPGPTVQEGVLPQSRFIALGIAAASLMLAAPAWAALGGAMDSVMADSAHFAARMTSTTAATHAEHDLTLANGAVVREFTRPDGAVFAVTWHAQGRPDLRQLLGVHFDAFQADNALQGGRRTHRPLSVARSDFIVQSGGHPGAVWGVAYLPQMAPPGFFHP